MNCNKCGSNYVSSTVDGDGRTIYYFCHACGAYWAELRRAVRRLLGG
jgi:transcription elongation factor Elf1